MPICVETSLAGKGVLEMEIAEQGALYLGGYGCRAGSPASLAFGSGLGNLTGGIEPWGLWLQNREPPGGDSISG